MFPDLVTRKKMYQRELLEKTFGRTLSHFVMHTPHALRRDVLEEIESRFPDEIAYTRASTFRRDRDLNLDQFHHYFAEITGRAITASARYIYVNLGDEAQQEKLEMLLAQRDNTFFCLNDVPIRGNPGIPSLVVSEFLEAYFPVPSSYEI
jgi:hypothetical protein